MYSSRDTVAGVDTLRRLDITCAGTNANYPDPMASVLRNHVANFDLPQCGPGGANGVPAYGRMTYTDEYPGIDLQIYSGLGGQRLAFVTGINPVKDGFLVRFDQAQDLQWASYFGGQGGTMTTPENVNAVLNLGNSIYAVGYSSRHAVGDLRIPLDGDSNSDMFFNQFYNYDGQLNNYSDGFIAEFCNELPPKMDLGGAPDQTSIQDVRTLRVSWSTSGELALLGLPDGPHNLRVYDAQGRVVLDQTVHSSAGRSEMVRLADRTAAIYLVVVDNQRTGRLVPIR